MGNGCTFIHRPGRMRLGKLRFEWVRGSPGWNGRGGGRTEFDRVVYTFRLDAVS
jgi:hypothetical protein